MSGNYGTPFTESEIVLAAQAGDVAHARKLLAESYPNELRELEAACHRVIQLIREVSE